MTTEVEQSKLNIHVLNQNQYEGLSSVSDTELYIVDPQFQGGKFLASDANGDIVEKDALQGVQLNGTDLTLDANNKVNIPLATNSTDGVLHPSPTYGTTMGANGILLISDAIAGGTSIITEKQNAYRPLTARCIDLAVKVGVTTNTNTLTDTEKQNACNWLGASQETEIVDWIET